MNAEKKEFELGINDYYGLVHCYLSGLKKTFLKDLGWFNQDINAIYLDFQKVKSLEDFNAFFLDVDKNLSKPYRQIRKRMGLIKVSLEGFNVIAKKHHPSQINNQVTVDPGNFPQETHVPD